MKGKIDCTRETHRIERRFGFSYEEALIYHLQWVKSKTEEEAEVQ